VNRGGRRVITRVFVITGFVLLSAMLHEFGHTWVSARQGFPIKRFCVAAQLADFPWAIPTVQGESAGNLRKEILIALAGPLMKCSLARHSRRHVRRLGTVQHSSLTPLVTPANLVTSFFLDQRHSVCW